jgi:antitoxin (DNA-binding transcriptional repressor) of toxin-antitoxin stability system
MATSTFMEAVGVRYLKSKLSVYLRGVRLGEGVLVTDWGEVLAEFLTPWQGQVDPALHCNPRQRRRSVAHPLEEERGSR